MIPAFHAINEAFEELEEWCDDHQDKIAEHEMPSALVLTVDPRSNPNSRARIGGDAELLVQVMIMAARDNEEFREALVNAIPQLFDLAS